MAERKWFFNGKSYTRAQLEQFVAPGDTVDDLINFIDSGQQAYEMPRDPNTGLTIPFEGTGQAPDPVPIPMSELRGGSGSDSMIGGGGRDTLGVPLATQRPADMRGARRSNAPPTALTDAISYAVGRTYGPGYSFQVRSGIVNEPKGRSAASSSGRHIMDGPGAADIRIFDPQGNQLSGDSLTPLAQNWVSNFGSIGVNRTASETDAHGWTHMDLVNKPGRGQGYVWSYGGFAPGAKEKIVGWVGKKAWTDGQPGDEVTAALYDAADATRAASVRKAPPRSGVLASLFGRGDLGTVEPPPQDAQSAIASLVNPGGGTQVPDAPTAAMGYAPTIPDGGFGSPPAPPSVALPMPQPPPQWAQAAGFPMDEALTGASAQDVLSGGPRLDPRRAIGSAPIGPTTAQGVLDMGPRPRPLGPEVPMPTPPSRPDNFVWNGGGAPDANAVPNPSMRPGPFASSFPARPEGPAGGMPAAPRPPAISAVTGSEQFGPGTKSGLAQYQMYMPPEQYGPGDATGRIRYDNYLVGQDMQRRNEEFGAALDSRFLAGDLGFRRAQMERYMPDYRAPPTATMGERFDAASPYPNADQMFGLAPLNGASFPAPPPVVGTAEAGSTTGEFFTPAPPMPQPPPDPMAGRFEDAFSPGGPGMIADLQGAYDARQGSPQPGMTAQDGINQIFGAPPAPAAVPNLAIPFAEVPGIGPSPAEAATVASPLPQPMTQGDFSARFGGPPMPSAAPQPISQQQFDERFAGGTVTPSPPKPGQPGVVAGEMPTPAGAMDIRPPAQGGPGLPPAPANPGALPGSAPAMPSPSPSSPPRQPNPGAERQRKGIIGRVLGGLLGGPVGALGGGLLGGGFGGAQTFTPYGNPIMNTGMGSFRTSGTSPYGTNGTTNWKSGQSNALGGSNALQWTGSKGQTITAVTDPWTGQTYTSYGP